MRKSSLSDILVGIICFLVTLAFIIFIAYLEYLRYKFYWTNS